MSGHVTSVDLGLLFGYSPFVIFQGFLEALNSINLSISDAGTSLLQSPSGLDQVSDVTDLG